MNGRHWDRTIRSTAVAACALALAGGAWATTGNAVLTWNNAALEEIRRSKLSPPAAARALAIAHTCIYDAWAPYDDAAVAAVAPLSRLPVAARTLAAKTQAVSHAAYRCLVNLFPAGTSRLASVLTGLGYDPHDARTDPSLPVGVGNSVATAVIASRRNDGSNQYGDLAPGAYSDYTGYTPRNGPMPFCLPAIADVCNLNIANPNVWQPLINDLGVLQKFASPHWERVTPFALTSADQYDTQPGVSPNYLRGPLNYLADVNSMLFYSSVLDVWKKTVVEYWADGPESELPPGHWALFAQHISRRDNHTLDDDAKMFFAMHNASLDAGIVAWHLKRKYEGVRPITAVRQLKKGQWVWAWGGPSQPVKWIDGGKWTPYNPGSNLSPAFPGFISGHSTFSAASAAALRAFKGNDWLLYSATIPPGFGRVEPNEPPYPVTLNFVTLTDAVQQAGMSRLYAGIHFPDDNTVGLDLGDKIGRQAWDKAQALFTSAAGAVADWSFNTTPSPGSVTDLSGSGSALTLNAGTTVVNDGVSGASLKFSGAAQPLGATSTRPLVDTAGSFSVSGWIRFDQLPNCQNQALASQDGNTVYGFILGMVAPCNGAPGYFRFSMRSADADNSVRVSAASNIQPAVGKWVHIVGVRDAAWGTMTLYVDGKQAGWAANWNRWQATGAFAVGRAKFSGQPRDPVYGNVDAVRVFNRPLSAQQAAALYRAAR